MHKKTEFIKIGILLIGLSVILHGLHFALFKDFHHIAVYLLGDIAFVPLEVFLVTLVIDRMMAGRERANLMEKLSMLIGLFYQEVGQELLKTCAAADSQSGVLQQQCHVTAQWEEKDYKKLESVLKQFNYKLDLNNVDLDGLYSLLDSRKELMVSLIANPSLLEHDTFSELLMSVNHMHEELALRKMLNNEDTSRKDRDHLRMDLERVYGHLAQEWLLYMKHLKVRYPYLFVTAMINNPFESRQRTEVEREVRGALYEVAVSETS